MQALSDVLRRATANITRAYVEFPIDAGEQAVTIYRERVYCYELYHQMRCGWDDVCEGYTLNGEVDKNGHQAMANAGIRYGIPDLLVHRPGPEGMRHNHAIIEVKSPTVDRAGVAGDVEQLDRFVRLARYTRGIFLVYASGQDDGRWLDIFRQEIQAQGVVTPLELWLHRRAGTTAECVFEHRLQ